MARVEYRAGKRRSHEAIHSNRNIYRDHVAGAHFTGARQRAKISRAKASTRQRAKISGAKAGETGLDQIEIRTGSHRRPGEDGSRIYRLHREGYLANRQMRRSHRSYVRAADTRWLRCWPWRRRW